VTKYRPQLTYGHPVPESFFDALQEFISTLATNFQLTLAPGVSNQVQVVAGTGNAQVGIGIEGLWRYNSATVTTQVTGAAGTYDLFVTCADNSFITNPSPPPPESDQTNYAFNLTAVVTGQTPSSVAHSRRVGQAITDGTRIVALRQMVGEVDGQQLLQPGMIQSTAAATVPPGWLLCNGQAVSRNTYAALYAALGGTNSQWGQGDGSSTFNVPDLRGKVQIGAGAGAVGGVALTARTLAAQGGSEAVTLTAAQSGTNGSGTTGNDTPDHTHNVPAQWTGTENQGHVHLFYDGSGAYYVGFASGFNFSWNYGGGGQTNPVLVYSGAFNWVNQTTGENQAHQHYVNSVNTGGRQQYHAHPLNARDADQSHANVQPFAVVNVIIKT
jgi:microcystin-dependent protein